MGDRTPTNIDDETDQPDLEDKLVQEIARQAAADAMSRAQAEKKEAKARQLYEQEQTRARQQFEDRVMKAIIEQGKMQRDDNLKTQNDNKAIRRE